jgi:hypothetical protein
VASTTAATPSPVPTPTRRPTGYRARDGGPKIRDWALLAAFVAGCGWLVRYVRHKGGTGG